MISLAARYADRGVPFSELVQEGDKADHVAAGRAPVAQTWAAGVIDGLTRAGRRMLQVLGREPTAEELAAELDLSPP